MKSSNLAVSAIAIFALLLVSEPVAAITCSDVVKDLSSCIKYLGNGVGSPPTACCTGASNLAAAASTTADKKIACNCIKSTAQSIKVNAAAAKALPGLCRITLPFAVSTSVDCTKYFS
ncbi:Non-specific lipid-transfer protein [Thalictrum thalictroides]|uniref:Non-specific lipid-transfer protein n=1 Tax=Thalictrum thalictroides TaxID=46969 RepID=A0A7J6UU68_THATH|nr:Non-specific lipid-transfer protein [Thalictrum thalictroides]